MSHLSIDMKTKVVQHVSRIISNVVKVFKFSKFSGSQRLSDFQTFFHKMLLDKNFKRTCRLKSDDDTFPHSLHLLGHLTHVLHLETRHSCHQQLQYRVVFFCKHDKSSVRLLNSFITALCRF